DDHARTILTGCRRAAGPNGTVVVIESAGAAGTAMDLFMLMCFGGRERTLDELVELAAGCGLVLRGSGPVADGRTVLEFRSGPDDDPDSSRLGRARGRNVGGDRVREAG